MGNIWNMCLETWQAYWGEAGHIFLFLLGLLYLMIRKKEQNGGSKEKRIDGEVHYEQTA